MPLRFLLTFTTDGIGPDCRVDKMMKRIENIAYARQWGMYGTGDLYLPSNLSADTRCALTIHGGGWSGMDKADFTGVAEFLCRELKLAVFNINYRLCGDAPWPACGDDCLAAAEFLFGSCRAELNGPNRQDLLIVGASAGGHLALMTGLRLPPERVAGIVSISGIADIESDRAFAPDRYDGLFHHAPSAAELLEITPATWLTAQSPPILCTHEQNDNVVPAASAENFIAIATSRKKNVRSYFYNRREDGYSHRIWIPGSSPHRLYPDIAEQIADFRNTLIFSE